MTHFVYTVKWHIGNVFNKPSRQNAPTDRVLTSVILKGLSEKYIQQKSPGWCTRVYWHLKVYILLAHLSRRLIGELIVYQWSGVRRPSVVRRPSSASSTMLKDLLLRNRWSDQSQILCGASLGRGNESLFAASGSHDQDGRHAHIWSKPFKNLLLQNRRANFHETWYVASGTPAHHSLFK